MPVSLSCKEYRTGAEIGPLNRNEILKLRRAPFDTARALMTSYSIVAELGCFKVLDLPFPENVLCTYFETCAAINGLDIAGLQKKRPKLSEACDLFGIEHTVTRASKDILYETVLEHENYTEEQWRVIAEGNRADVLLESMLLGVLAQTINVPAALHRGRTAKAVPGHPDFFAAPAGARAPMAGASNAFHRPRRQPSPVRRQGEVLRG